jgi:ABC-2 type transport system permease protein
MSPFRKGLRQTLTIARRDFVATVFTPVFLLFLFAPLIAGSFSALAGMGAAGAAGDGVGKARIVAIVPPDRTRTIAEADTRLRTLFRDGEAPPELTTLVPAADPAAQARAAFGASDHDAVAVLYGPLDRPTILYGPRGPRAADYLVGLAQATLTDERLGADRPRVEARRVALQRPGPSIRGGHQSAFFAVFGIFFLTLFLAGQVVGTMAEERNNKVIEVLAAAVPLESVFLGKLVGMFGVAVLFVAFWAGVVSQIGALMPAGLRDGLGDLAPATGGAFPLLFIAYFTMAYLLLGSVFLGVGAQATTPREIQMLSLPITVTQVGMFALASSAAARPGSGLALVAELFPLSSPFAMVGHAANQPGIWRHLAALAWQALWVAVCVTAGARLFRRGVLQSGSARPRFGKGRRQPPAIDTAVS